MSSRPDHDPYAPPSAPVGGMADDASPTAEHLEGPPLLTIWTRPRSTIRTLVDLRPAHGAIPLAGASGFGGALAQLLQGKPAEELSLGGALGLAAFIGPIAGILVLYVAAAVVRMTGGWLGGRATVEEARAAWAWGSVPNLATTAVMIGSLLAFGPAFFLPDRNAPPDPNLALVIGFVLTLYLWGFILTLKCLGEVQRFSALTAFASVLLAFLMAVAVAVVVALILIAGGGLPAGG